jgi:amidase
MGATIDHAVTRSIRDSATILDCIAGYEPGDPYTAPLPSNPFASFVGSDPGQVRVGLLDQSALDGFTVDSECSKAVVATGTLLQGLGHQVEQGHPAAMGEAEFQGRFVEIIAASSAAQLLFWGGVLGRTIDDDELEPANALFTQMGRAIPATRYLEDVDWMHAYTRRMAAWWADHDLLVTPVIASPPPPIGWLSDETEGLQRVIQLIQFTPQFNITGQPAVSLPLHRTASGLPVGVQLVAAYGREDLLLAVGAQLEAVAPWAHLRPPVHG